MTPRRLLILWCAVALGSALSGCASLEPNHVTVFYERDDEESQAAMRGTRTVTNKSGISATYDLTPHR